ncbi:MAG: 2-dehydropantoate 2-reductase [Anaerolineales bacterium]|nr:2-dehydropantoate 2-reductase [Anaerolineales bacterium]
MSEILIVGSGALATLFAARLGAAGNDITLLGSWAQALEALNNGGAQLEGRPAVRVRASADPAEFRGAHQALVLVKAWQTERAAAQLAECLAPDGLAVSLQNGLGNREILASCLGPQRATAGVTTGGATLLGPGLVRPGGEGILSLEAHPRLDSLVSALRAAGFPVQAVVDAVPLIWGKLVINAAINPLTALLRRPNGALLASQETRQWMGNLAREAAAVATALGIRLPYDDPPQAVEEVARQTAKNLSSMLQDVLRGAPTEIEAINGAVVRLGAEAGVATPLNRIVWQRIRDLSPNANFLPPNCQAW